MSFSIKYFKYFYSFSFQYIEKQPQWQKSEKSQKQGDWGQHRNTICTLQDAEHFFLRILRSYFCREAIMGNWFLEQAHKPLQRGS